MAIAVAVRFGAPNPQQPATVHYTRIQGDRATKLGALDSITSFGDLTWEACPSGWHDPFRPKGVGAYFDWPTITDIYPWQHSGVQVKRAWPIAPDDATLQRRWDALLAAPNRATEFRETRDRKVTKAYSSTAGAFAGGPSLSSLSPAEPLPPTSAYGYRCLDRQRLLADYRVIDFPRPTLAAVHSDQQVYLTTLTTHSLGRGPAVFASAALPDLHHFRGSFGGKDVMPLWRDSSAKTANLKPDLLAMLSSHLGKPISPDDLTAYVYGLLCSSAYRR